MQSFPISFFNGHLFIKIGSNNWLLDTGAPTSFGNVTSITIEKRTFSLPVSYMGLTGNKISEYVDRHTVGIIGTDILNQFNVLFDLPNQQASFSTDAIDLVGNTLDLDEFMGVPIFMVEIAGTKRQMFFDTGAQISYFQDHSLNTFPSAGLLTDFYPGVGQFETETYWLDAVIGTEAFKLRCGTLPELLRITVSMAGTEGIVGNEILDNRIVGYFPKDKRMVIA
jgi:hypothetical protein